VSPPARVHITGVSGAGKSTLARRIGRAFDLPVHHLDEIAIDPATRESRSLEERHALVARITADPRWVTDGVQTGWTDPLCERADLIVWLDQLAGSRASVRIVRRFTRQAWQEFRRQRGRGRFLRVRSYAHHARALVRSLLEVREFDRAAPDPEHRDSGSRAATIAQLEPYRAKVRHCRSAHDVDELLRQLGVVTPGASATTADDA